PAAAIQRPGGSPNSFDHGTNSATPGQKAEGQAKRPGHGKPAHFGPRRPLVTENIARDQAQYHRGERRNKSQRGVAALVVEEGAGLGKEIQKPSVKRPRQ